MAAEVLARQAFDETPKDPPFSGMSVVHTSPSQARFCRINRLHQHRGVGPMQLGGKVDATDANSIAWQMIQGRGGLTNKAVA